MLPTQTARLASMTGYGQAAGETGGLAWTWDLRSVNGRGLDLKFRLPGGFEALDARLRSTAGEVLRRGNINATLTIHGTGTATLRLDRALLESFLAEAQALAARTGAPPPRAEALLALPGVIRRDAADDTPPDAALLDAVAAGFVSAIKSLEQARLDEGQRLHAVLSGQIDSIEALVTTADSEAASQPEAAAARMRAAIAKLAGEAGVSEERLAQEIAILANRCDVQEELDRLRSHIAAARACLLQGSPAGRQLDFLVQEFGRETNTLCSKSASTALTATGLKLKVILEQFREQVQNIE